MASEERAMPDALTLLRQFEDAAYRYDFFQAVRLLENAFPDKPRIGESLLPRDEPIRFTHEPDLIFHPTTLGAFTPANDQHAARLAVKFFGLFGPHGPLPTHLTEYARDRQRNASDLTLVRFFDVFHHRMISLFYRAWANAQPAVSLDRPARDRFSFYIGSAFGLGEQTLRERDAVPDFAKLHFAGLLAGATRPAAGLKLVLERFFGVPVEIEQWVGHWMALPASGVSRLGALDGSASLGVSTLLGARVWDCQHKFRIVIGPLKIADYERFLPGGDSLRRLVDWVRNYARDGLDWDVNLLLRKTDVPRLKLGRHARLGYTSWVLCSDAPGDQRQLILTPTDQAGRPRTSTRACEPGGQAQHPTSSRG
jgi:type VI secretion system protein ImpH